MYKTNTDRGNSRGASAGRGHSNGFRDRSERSFRPARSFGGDNRGGSRGRFNTGGNRGGRGSGRRQPEHIEYSRFINKASKVEEVAYAHVNEFNDFNIDALLKLRIAARKFTAPSPIQDQAIPHAINGRDVLGIANTGTGKTAAFLIPLINKILKDKNQRVLVMAPTRELAIQIEKELYEFTHGMRMFSAVCVGGSPIFRQISQLRRGVSFIIGTPGRLMDLVERGEIDLSTIQNVVLDEADRMLDMGFVNDIRSILAQMPENKQSLFFSATFPPEIERLVNTFTKDPIKVMVKTRDTSKNVDQDIVKIDGGRTKIDVLEELLKDTNEFKKVLVFAEMKSTVDKLGKELEYRGFKAGSIHGDKRQGDRVRTLQAFRNNNINILVATDVAARGLDIPEVSHVINYEVPESYDTYVHRIGRTGRANATGKALTFV